MKRLRVATVVVGLIVSTAAVPSPATAGPAPAPGAHAEVSADVAHGLSAPLRSLGGRAGAAVTGARPALRLPDGAPARSAAAVPVARTPLLSPTPRVPVTPVADFPGIASTGSATPPDANSDVGPDHVVEMVNGQTAVFDKTGATLVAPVISNAIWSALGTNPCATRNDGDPIVRFDPLADRWVLSQFALPTLDGAPGPNYECVAVSRTADPTGDYYTYAFDFADFPDYPKLGVWPDGYYVSFFMFNTAGTSFLGGQTCALDRAAMLVGDPATKVCTLLGSDGGGNPYAAPLPADVDGATAPPAGEPNYQVALNSSNDGLDVWQFHVDWATPGNSTVTRAGVAVDPFTFVCPGSPSLECVPQAGTSTKLDTLGDRLMFPLTYRRFGDHESLLVSHAVSVAGVTSQRWYELRVQPGGSLAVYQQGTYAPGDGVHRFMGSLAMDRQGNVLMGYSASSASIHPGIRLTGRAAGDPPGAMTQTEVVALDGAFSEVGAYGRWGDYSSMNVDPADDCTFWYTNQYYTADNQFSWATRLVSYRFPDCAPSDFSLAASTTTGYVSGRLGNSATTTLGTQAVSGAGEVVTLTASGVPSGAGAAFARNQLGAGESTTLTFTPGSAAAGTYPITVTGSSASATHSVTYTLKIDNTAPSASMTAPTAAFVVGSSARVAWAGSDAGSGILRYEVRRRSAAFSGGFGPWGAVTAYQATAVTAGSLARGYTYCWQVRAVDRAGNTSAWSTPRCTAVPLDDRSLSVTSSWVRGTGVAYWNGTVSKASRTGATMTRTGAQVDRIAVVARRCSTCGVLGVYVSGVLVGKVNTYGGSAYRVLYVLPKFAYRTGTVTLKVLSPGKPVYVDGVGLTRA